ncbi:DNA internalization-related competence protein ComEC/Rec2 [Cohnella cellulosilytica]|uniref:DNA internalization-related competence protein ComEC/Rec2 n=1 Tax=Cohnella cellulosilytica TaxID=986710 RepID=A0ABW2FBF8_9BACL
MAAGALLLMLLAAAMTGLASPRLACVCAAALVLAHAERTWTEQRLSSDIPAAEVEACGGAAELAGRLDSVAEVDGDLVAFRLRAETIRLGDSEERRTKEVVVVRVKLAKPSEQQTAGEWRRGDRVLLTGVLELPGQASNFGAFDYRRYLMKQGVFWQVSVQGLEQVEYTRVAAPWPMKPLRALDELRDTIGRLADRLYPGGDSGYMKGLVVGIRSDLDPVQFDNFARLGLTHILAISGLHVGVIVYLLLQICGWLRLTRERSLELTLAMMPVYMLVTGASPSAVRACLMAMIALGLARRHALKDGLHLLFAAAMVMLIWNPSLIEDVSFQLSFLVTAGLILVVPAVSDLLPIRWKGLKGAVAVTVTAQLVSFPVSVYYFHSMHLLSLPANFLLVPFISAIVMPLGMASLTLGGIWLPLGVIPAKLATLGNDLTFGIVDWLNGFIQWRTIWPQPSLLWVASAYALMGVGLAGLRRRSRRLKEREWWTAQAAQYEAQFAGASVTSPLDSVVPGAARSERARSLAKRCGFGIALTAWLVWGAQPAWTDREAAVSFLDVGQGDSILIRTGYGKRILIDAGGTVSFRKPGDEWRERNDPYEVGRKLLVPLLLQRGIRQLDALVLTHMDTDHIGGARAVLDNIPVRAVLFNGTIKDSSGALALMRAVANRGIPVYAAHESLEWQPDPSVNLRVLYPSADDSQQDSPVEASDKQNERSVVLLAEIYGRRFLLPGDLEAGGEIAIVDEEYASGRNGAGFLDGQRPAIDVLKAGHHGSKTSTTGLWVDFWQPRETVISVGRNNFYGHPSPEVLYRLESAGSEIWRTDLNGEVQYRISPGGTMRRRTMMTLTSEPHS